MNRLRHPLLRAYANLYASPVPNGSFILDLESLASSYRARAVELDPDHQLARGETPSDVAVKIASVRNAYRLVRDVMGDQSTWVSAWQTDAARPKYVQVRSVAAPEVGPLAAPSGGEVFREVRGWSARPVAPAEALDLRTRRSPVVKARHVETVRTRAGEPPVDKATREAIYRDLLGPRRPLLGRFMVQEGMITLSQLISAVTWQRNQRPPVGRIAVDWGMLSSNDVIDLLKSKRARLPFCSHCVQEKALEPTQRVAVLAQQRIMQRPLGEYFVERGLLSASQVERAAEKARSIRL